MTDMTREQIEAVIAKLEPGKRLGWVDKLQIQAAIRQLQRGWWGIESAPKDGTEIDVWIGGEFPHRATPVSWRVPSESEWWVHGGDTIETPDATWHDAFGPLGPDESPTHWMPLPLPPAGDV